MEAEPKFTSLAEVSEFIRRRHSELLEQHLSRFEQLFKPFVWEDILPFINQFVERHSLYFDPYKENLGTFLEIQIDKKLNFANKDFLRLEYLEDYVKTHLKEEDQQLINLLGQQRLMNLANGDEVAKLLTAKDELFEFEVKQRTVEGLDKEKIYLMSKWPLKNEIFGFTTNDKIMTFSAAMETTKSTENTFGSVVSIDFFEGFMAIGNRAGNLFIVDAESLKPKWVFHFSMWADKADFASVFPLRGRTLH